MSSYSATLIDPPCHPCIIFGELSVKIFCPFKKLDYFIIKFQDFPILYLQVLFRYFFSLRMWFFSFVQQVCFENQKCLLMKSSFLMFVLL